MDFVNIMSHLESKGYEVKCFNTGKEAKDFVLSIIEDGADIGMGGSVTVADLEIPEALIEKGHRVYSNKYITDMDPHDVRMSASSADYYLCSSNAITSNGTLVNIDGVCNRISAMCYGPRNLVYIIGKNKITSDVPAAIKRIKDVACPKNAKRLGLTTPCAVTGKCTDCNSIQRMCRNTLITERPPRDTHPYVILINEELGY